MSSSSSAAARARGDQVGPVPQRAGLGQRRDRQPVPRGDDLVVAARLRPRRARLAQLRAQAGPARGLVLVGPRVAGQPGRRRPVLERARGVTPSSSAAHAPSSSPRTSASCAGVQTYVRPSHALRVGVERRGEAALRGAQLGDHPVAGLLGDPGAGGIAGEAPPVQVDPRELGVVVEHLLEVRHDPGAVDGVAREPARHLVVHAAARHRDERAGGEALGGRGGGAVAGRGRRAAAGTRRRWTAGTSARRRARRARLSASCSPAAESRAA